ncbi:hypothetical protein E2C01_039434 [Portunus trituberculatus]|uniref:Uncharacterized protein n=1 Tax=Portunus trituberculatus TaxID=210409 RepID=A0A5B7FLC8_PORTR|nr:hypothetical protein [Portunus trituberculatus]
MEVLGNSATPKNRAARISTGKKGKNKSLRVCLHSCENEIKSSSSQLLSLAVSNRSHSAVIVLALLLVVKTCVAARR